MHVWPGDMCENRKGKGGVASPIDVKSLFVIQRNVTRRWNTIQMIDELSCFRSA